MEQLLEILTFQHLCFAVLVAAIAGIVKGVVGFAMPMVFITGLSTFLSPELALAGLIVPTLFTNVFQALRQGPAAAWNSIIEFRVFLFFGLLALIVGAQLVRLLPLQTMLLVIGLPIVLFALLQLAGVEVKLSGQSFRVAAGVGAFAGFMGGLSGIWGPPTVVYLAALGTNKNDHMRIQGVIYGLGAVALTFAHLGSGVLRSETLPFSLAMVPPALLGLWLGGRVFDRIDQVMFRRATLVVLLIAGLNLVRRATMFLF
ncbi:MAG: sulfite exporter TauE/SafE family protein [Ascidiaceihabitans sp.]|jgi:uncharacterized membrane protein YfcA|tara:strand:+ start:40315 stop:41088 length:774 start_codon:yes stop_codon:yes gene_type:complete